ncbi:MAG: succinate--CoA ligase subunit alpha, partial [Candidatus Methylomirabilis sp.]|nr:succinate--CoA ligase subunit alpha [Deltaproteobacteria bacterium]
ATMLTLAGLGQTACVSVGGEPMVGSTFADLYPLFLADPDTRAIVCYCEPGGTAEEDLAALVAATAGRKPVAAFVAGRFADRMQGMRFGHAAVIVEGERGSTESKIRAFEAAGVAVAERIGDIAPMVRRALGEGA